MIVLRQPVQRAVDGAVVGQRAFGIPAVKGDAELAQVLLDVAQDGGLTYVESATETILTDQRARAHDQRIDVGVFVAALGFIGRQVAE